MSYQTQVPDSISMETIRYEMERFSASVMFDPSVLESMRLERSDFAQRMSNQMAYRLLGSVAMWRKQRVLEVPANWWEHLKERWFPQWALKRWPVLTRHYDAGVILPRVPVVRPEYHTVEFPVWRQSGGATAF
jgi:hypothetical protein